MVYSQQQCPFDAFFFDDLRMFVAKFCRQELRTFSANFFRLKTGSPNFFVFRMYAISFRYQPQINQKKNF